MTTAQPPSVFTTPEWIASILQRRAPSDPARLMELALEIALSSAENGGGPFGVVIADSENRPISIGWNRVLELNDSTAHAEIVALRRAQKELGTVALGACPGGPITLYTSAAPCIQCFGALYWSGIARVFAAARKEDVEKIGFDEGPVSAELWKVAKTVRGIEYTADFCRDAHAIKPLDTYRNLGGKIY